MSLSLILTNDEQNKFNLVPKFTFEQRKFFFTITDNLLDKIYTFENDDNRIIFILLYGTFRATNRFFDIVKYGNNNVEYIQNQYNLWKTDFSSITSRRVQQYQQLIKQHLAINDYTDKIKEILLNEATTLANNFTHRKKIFYSLVTLSIKLKIEVPSYTELSRIITVAINSNKKTILDKLTPFLKDERLNVLDEFLQKDEEYHNRWHLTRYKILEHSTKKKQMTLSLSKVNTIKSKFKMR